MNMGGLVILDEAWFSVSPPYIHGHGDSGKAAECTKLRQIIGCYSMLYLKLEKSTFMTRQWIVGLSC